MIWISTHNRPQTSIYTTNSNKWLWIWNTKCRTNQATTKVKSHTKSTRIKTTTWRHNITVDKVMILMLYKQTLLCKAILRYTLTSKHLLLEVMATRISSIQHWDLNVERKQDRASPVKCNQRIHSLQEAKVPKRPSWKAVSTQATLAKMKDLWNKQHNSDHKWI